MQNAAHAVTLLLFEIGAPAEAGHTLSPRLPQ